VKSLVIERRASADIDEARDWYREKSALAAIRFLRNLDLTLQAIETSPMRFSIFADDIRMAEIKRYPYCVYFYETDHTIQVVAVYHDARDPDGWQSRLG
jgi:plasmid stabilization system protein ParE